VARNARLKATLTWLAIPLLAGAFGSYFLELGFWSIALIVGLSLIANGILADWEDRGTFND
jgi:uncharacterized membrane protein